VTRFFLSPKHKKLRRPLKSLKHKKPLKTLKLKTFSKSLDFSALVKPVLASLKSFFVHLTKLAGMQL